MTAYAENAYNADNASNKDSERTAGPNSSASPRAHRMSGGLYDKFPSHPTAAGAMDLDSLINEVESISFEHGYEIPAAAKDGDPARVEPIYAEPCEAAGPAGAPPPPPIMLPPTGADYRVAAPMRHIAIEHDYAEPTFPIYSAPAPVVAGGSSAAAATPGVSAGGLAIGNDYRNPRELATARGSDGYQVPMDLLPDASAAPTHLAGSAPAGLAARTDTVGPRYTQVSREHLARRALARSTSGGTTAAAPAAAAAAVAAVDGTGPSASSGGGALGSSAGGHAGGPASSAHSGPRAIAVKAGVGSTNREYEYAEVAVTHDPDSGSASDDEESADDPAGSTDGKEAAEPQPRALDPSSIRRPKTRRLLAPELRKSFHITADGDEALNALRVDVDPHGAQPEYHIPILPSALRPAYLAVPGAAASTAASASSSIPLSPAGHPGTASVLKTCSVYTTARAEPLERSGRLYVRSWKKAWQPRWIVLAGPRLAIHKTDNEASRLAVSMELNAHVSVRRGETRADRVYHLLIVASPSCSFILGTPNIDDREAWLGLLLRTAAAAGPAPTVQLAAWLSKAKHGFVRRSFCSLIENSLYFGSSEVAIPHTRVPLLGTTITPHDADDDSDGEEAATPLKHAITLAVPQEPHAKQYDLLFSAKEERDRWAFLCQLATGTLPAGLGTVVERAIVNVTDQASLVAALSSPALAHSATALGQPLTTIMSAPLESTALELHKALLLFMGTPINAIAVDYHVRLSQGIISKGIAHPQLRNEFVSFIVRQCNRPVSNAQSAPFPGPATSPTAPSTSAAAPAPPVSLLRPAYGPGAPTATAVSPTHPSAAVAGGSGVVLAGFADPLEAVLGWKLLALTVPVFQPTSIFLRFLQQYCELHLKSPLVAPYASYCLHFLRHKRYAAPRRMAPSRVETTAILLHALQAGRTREPPAAMSVPVFLTNGGHILCSFHARTTCSELAAKACGLIGVRHPTISGFAIFASQPDGEEESGSTWAVDKSYVCDVLASWEKSLHDSAVGRVDRTRVPMLSLRRRLFFAAHHQQEDESDVERILLAYQINQAIVAGLFPIDKDMVFRQAAWMAQMEWGDREGVEDADSIVVEVMGRFVPKHYSTKLSPVPSPRNALRQAGANAAVERSVVDMWSSLHNNDPVELSRAYIAFVKAWNFYGATVFPIELAGPVPIPALLAVHEAGIIVMEPVTFRVTQDIAYNVIKQFGNSAGEFTVTYKTGSGRRQLLCKCIQRNEIALLMASYINAIVRREGLRCEVAQIGQSDG